MNKIGENMYLEDNEVFNLYYDSNKGSYFINNRAVNVDDETMKKEIGYYICNVRKYAKELIFLYTDYYRQDAKTGWEKIKKIHS